MDERVRERTVTRRQLHENPQAVYEQARGGYVVIVDEHGTKVATLAVPTDELPVHFDLR